MLTDELKEQIIASVTEFLDACRRYEETVVLIANLNQEKVQLQRELEELKKKEKLEDMFSQAVYLSPKSSSETEQIEAKFSQVESQLSNTSSSLGKLRNKILHQAKTLRFPIDPQKVNPVDGRVEFSYIEGSGFSKTALNTLADLLDLESPLKVEDVTYLKDKVVVEPDSSEEALAKIVNSVRSLRLIVEDMLQVYEGIDVFCKRIKASERYGLILTELYRSNESLTLDELARRTNVNKDTIYQSLYDLGMRDSWKPHPVKKTNDKYALTSVGILLMKRYAELYQEKNALVS